MAFSALGQVQTSAEAKKHTPSEAFEKKWSLCLVSKRDNNGCQRKKLTTFTGFVTLNDIWCKGLREMLGNLGYFIGNGWCMCRADLNKKYNHQSKCKEKRFVALKSFL